MAGSNKARRQATEKAAQLRAAQLAAERRRTRTIIGAVAAVVLIVAGAVTWAIVNQNANKPDLGAVASYSVSAGHVPTTVDYEQSPPVGGLHNDKWLNCGIYDRQVPNEYAVHSLEHGAVWVTYRADLPADQVSALTKLIPSTYAILSPVAGLKAPVVASAWGHQLDLTGVDDPRLPAFIKAYRQNPNVPEPGALCTNGTDGTTPVG